MEAPQRKVSFLLATPDRVAALSEQLTHVHGALREQLSSLRREAARGVRPPAADAAAGEHLLSHCLSFCAAMIDNIIEDHGLVAEILRQIRALLAQGQDPSGPGALVRELDGLTAILESHFSYEERRIANALDSLEPEAWAAGVFSPGQDPARRGSPT
jgi:hypothetical protein